jgi:hypothetical protein
MIGRFITACDKDGSMRLQDLEATMSLAVRPRRFRIISRLAVVVAMAGLAVGATATPAMASDSCSANTGVTGAGICLYQHINYAGPSASAGRYVHYLSAGSLTTYHTQYFHNGVGLWDQVSSAQLRTTSVYYRMYWDHNYGGCSVNIFPGLNENPANFGSLSCGGNGFNDRASSAQWFLL